MNLEEKLVRWVIDKLVKEEGMYRHPLLVSIHASCQLDLREKFDDIYLILKRKYHGPTEPDSLFDEFVQDPNNFEIMRERIKDLLVQNINEEKIFKILSKELTALSQIER